MLMPVYGSNEAEQFTFCHIHSADCYEEVVTEQEADGEDYGEITERSVCSMCGGEVHDYYFYAYFSCGKVIYLL